MSVWSDIASLVKTVLTLGKETEQNRNDIKDLREQLHALALKVEHLAGENRLTNEREASEREKLTLQLQLALERFERRLPPGEKFGS